MDEGRFRDLLPSGTEPHPTVVELLDELERNGWRARKFVNGRGLRLWPDHQRRRQITIDLNYPVNEHKLVFYREHTQLDLVLTETTQ